jgi:hypothetical protein
MQELELLLNDYTNAVRVAYTMSTSDQIHQIIEGIDEVEKSYYASLSEFKQDGAAK